MAILQLLIYLCCAVSFVFTVAEQKYETELKRNETIGINRNAKFWGVGVVRFENGVCTAIDGTMGTCYTRRQCREVDGTGAGRCAQIGVCCVVQRTCGDSSSENNTYFVSTNFPSTFSAASACAYTIKKCGSEICQVRIDFLNFNLAQPNGEGVCSTDALNILGGASVVPPICGENSGSHIYVDFNGEQDIRLLIQTGSGSTQRAWRFKIAQIGCDCATRAPSGCLQYYTAISGTVSSFNYGQTISSATNQAGSPGTRQMANTNYGICVAMAPGYCSITWAPTAGDAAAFSVSASTISATPQMVPIMGTDCTSDFIVVPNPSVGGVPTGVERYCGNLLPPLTTSSKPFVLTTVTNGDEMNDIGNRGFSLSYTQGRCANTLIIF